MRKTILKGIFGGRMLLLFSSEWKLILYIFILTLIYITVHYDVSESALVMLDYDQELKELKTDYTTRCSKLQEMTTVQRTDALLRQNGSDLRPPQAPPILVAR